MEVEITRITPDNAALLACVADGVFDEPIIPARVAAYVASEGHILLVALDGDEVVAQVAGVIHYHPDKPTELYIDEVGVAPTFQRLGIARAMLEQIYAIGRAAGCAEAWVGTEPDNVAARGLYESRGGTEPEPFIMYVYRL